MVVRSVPDIDFQRAGSLDQMNNKYTQVILVYQYHLRIIVGHFDDQLQSPSYIF